MQVETRHYDFYNDTKICQNTQEKCKLDECVKNIVRKEGYISCDVSKKIIPADGGNYLATLCEIDVKGKAADGDKETAIFVKSITSDCEAMDLLSVPTVYKNELFVYKELIKIYNKLQDERNIPEDQRYNTVKCFEESYDMAIIMENVARNGFKTWHRMCVVSISMAEECVKHLATFHALSFVLEQADPEYFAKNIKTRKSLLKFGDTWDQFIEKFSKLGLEILDADLRSKIEGKVPALMKKYEEYFTDESAKLCLCHGDYRSNNIMIKEVNGVVIKVIPVDYQLVAYGCPLLDLLYFIYLATDRKFRDTHLVRLKNLYYKSLNDFLHYFDMSAESVFPKKTFENLFQEKLDFGLVISFIALPFIFVAENHEVPDITERHIVDIEFQLDDKYKDRLSDVVEEFIDLGYL